MDNLVEISGVRYVKCENKGLYLRGEKYENKTKFMNPSFIADIKRIQQAIFHEATAFICLAWRIKKHQSIRTILQRIE